jgi:hypothetical protein
MAWIATTTALEGSASVGLGFIDYGSNYLKNDTEFLLAMRKKRLAFAKGGTFFLSIVGLMLIDQPSANSVLPLLLAQGYTAAKMGSQIGFNLTPDKFYIPRTFLAMYNLALCAAIWYKLR